MYQNFGLILMVNHACNLRCGYCYTGNKFSRAMSREIGQRAIDRALASIHRGGVLELGFFGGEPLIESELILQLLDYSTQRARQCGVKCTAGLTTNGTQVADSAWNVMNRPDVDLVISHDGLPEIHDRHRTGPDGRGSSARVLETLASLMDAGKDFRVQMVVRPDTVEFLADGIAFLRSGGVRYIEPSLDLWSRWTDHDIEKLTTALPAAADVWRDGIPNCGVSCFDEKVVELTGIAVNETARCGFGDGEIAVAPSGNLYPCERLIGEDAPGNPMRLAGHALDGADFLDASLRAARENQNMQTCAQEKSCDASCRCSNFVRTGDVSRSDGLLSTWHRICREQAARVLRELSVTVAS